MLKCCIFTIWTLSDIVRYNVSAALCTTIYVSAKSLLFRKNNTFREHFMLLQFCKHLCKNDLLPFCEHFREHYTVSRTLYNTTVSQTFSRTLYWKHFRNNKQHVMFESFIFQFSLKKNTHSVPFKNIKFRKKWLSLQL